MPKPAVERCGCGKLWYGPARTNPSLACDTCYPPHKQPVAGCIDCERHGECICWEPPTLGEMGTYDYTY